MVMAFQNPEQVELFKRAYKDVRKLVDAYVFAPFSLALDDSEIDDMIMSVVVAVMDDLRAFVTRDPAAKMQSQYVFDSYSCFQAVKSYRLAHELLTLRDLLLETGDRIELSQTSHGNGDLELALERIARMITEAAKVKCSVDIHPSAQIGRRFVIDHGQNTVIGETSTIGDDCYFLESVVLGGSDIADAKPERRHPQIGSNVKLAGGVRIYGPVSIGDNVTIQGLAVVDHDIPADTTVKVVSTLQLLKTKDSPKIFGVVPTSSSSLAVYGIGLSDFRPVFLLNRPITESSPKLPPLEQLKDVDFRTIRNTNDYLEFEFHLHAHCYEFFRNNSKLKRRLVLGLKPAASEIPAVYVINSFALQSLRLEP
jgi:serine acetyltransferase